MLLQDQKVIVTGAGQGIGKAAALKLAAAGADVAAVETSIRKRRSRRLPPFKRSGVAPLP